MIRKLRLKFVLVNMCIVLAMLLAIFATVYHFTKMNLDTQTEALLERLSQNTRRPSSFQEPDREAQLPYFSVQVTVHGNMITSGYSYYDITDETFIRELVQRVYAQQRNTGLLETYNLRYIVVSDVASQTILFVDISSQQATLTALVRACTLMGLLSLAAFFGISLFLAHWAVKPVDKAWKQQTQFVSDASRELKTPLTVIMSNAELLDSPDCPEADRKQFQQNILTMSHRMRALVEGLLELTRADNGQTRNTFTQLDFSQLVQETLLPFEPVFFEKNLVLESQIEAQILLTGSPQHLTQILSVLLDNAAKYAAPGLVLVKLQRQGRGSCLLSVASPGNPIPQEKLKTIFGRFSRLDTARTGDGSFGLGLSIAKSLTENHKGKIWAESNPTGNCFFVQLPCL